jgi:hypothetical protein
MIHCTVTEAYADTHVHFESVPMNWIEVALKKTFFRLNCKVSIKKDLYRPNAVDFLNIKFPHLSVRKVEDHNGERESKVNTPYRSVRRSANHSI